MISVTDARLIFFQRAKAKPSAIKKKTGMTGESGLNSSMTIAGGSGPRNYKDANNVKLRASLISMSAPQLASEMPPSRRCK